MLQHAVAGTRPDAKAGHDQVVMSWITHQRSAELHAGARPDAKSGHYQIRSSWMRL